MSKRIINRLETEDRGYEVGHDYVDGMTVTDISFFRDGILGIYKPTGDESHYRATIVNQDGADETHFIPSRDVKCVSTIDQKDDNVVEPEGV